MSKKPAPFPTDAQIIEFVTEQPGKVGKREIARAFQLNAEQKMDLKKALRRLERAGDLQRERGQGYAEVGALPDVTVIEVTGTDIDGDVLARPVTWDREGPEPLIYLAPDKRKQPAPGTGDRILARLERIEDLPDGRFAYAAKTIRRLAGAPKTLLGVMIDGGEDQPLRLRSTDKRAKSDFLVAPEHQGGAKPGDLVRAEGLPGKRYGTPFAKVVEVLSPESPKSISLIAIHDHDLPVEFPRKAVEQAEQAGPAPLAKREDLRALPLITIDGADARDFDDAVFAEPDGDGWHLIVAIADVSWYVRTDDALDKSAYERGNSTYFPDRVIPMLPEALSNGWCSLVPHEDRPCLAAHMWIDAEGKLKRHKIVRGLMHSHARTTYDQVQASYDGEVAEVCEPLMETVIPNLYGAYESLLKNRAARGVLELDLPEKRIMIDDDGVVTGVVERERFDSHKLIEEFMILANVASAETLEKKKQPCMYRIHDEPSREKLDALREFLSTVDMPFSKGQVIRSQHFNQILEKAKDSPQAHLINQIVLRSQSQAEYNPENIGHFGLALVKYAHFTSPIRRYADLLVHRALVRGCGLGEGGLPDHHHDFAAMGEHISATERRSSAAERDCVDRFAAAWLSERVGEVFKGKVNGVTRFGLFVTLDESGADGLVPIRSLPDDYYVHDEGAHELRGRSSGLTFKLGQSLEVVLREADAITGSMVMTVHDGGELKPISRARKGSKAGSEPLQRKGPRGAKDGERRGKKKPGTAPARKAGKAKKPKGKSRASRRRQRAKSK